MKSSSGLFSDRKYLSHDFKIRSATASENA